MCLSSLARGEKDRNLHRGQHGRGMVLLRRAPPPHHAMHWEPCQRANYPPEALAVWSFASSAAATAPTQRGSAYHETILAASSPAPPEGPLCLWQVASRR